MAESAVNNRYSRLSISLHWLMLALLVAVYSCILLRELYPKGSDLREGLKTWHFMLGLTVLVLVLVRLAGRLLGSVPAITPQPPRWQAISAKLVHIALYALMIVMPIAGWLILSASGKPVPFFGLELPALIGKSKPLAAEIQEIHETIGTIGYYLVGLHAAAALFHHYFVKDDTLRRMLPKPR
jgi:superoxide oxidase